MGFARFLSPSRQPRPPPALLPAPYHHPARDALQLRSLQAHALRDPQWRASLRRGQGAVRQDVVPRDEVELDSSRVVF